MRGCFEQEPQLGLVHLELVDLLVLKAAASQDRLWAKSFLGGASKTGVGRERSVGSQPGSDRSLGDLQARPFAEKALGLCERVAEIVDRDRLQNVLEGTKTKETATSCK